MVDLITVICSKILDLRGPAGSGAENLRKSIEIKLRSLKKQLGFQKFKILEKCQKNVKKMKKNDKILSGAPARRTEIGSPAGPPTLTWALPELKMTRRALNFD